jgi:hypothetical protein
MIQELKKEFPLVNFEWVDHCVVPRNESASYPFGNPKPEVIKGDFIRIQNPMGGADTVRSSDIKKIRYLAAWHQARAEASGFGA